MTAGRRISFYLLPPTFRFSLTANKCCNFANIGKARNPAFGESPEDAAKPVCNAAIKIKQELIMKTKWILSLVVALGFALDACADSKALYEEQCAKCHGSDGKGQTKMGQKLGIKNYTEAKVQAGFTDEKAFKAIKEGLKDKEDKTLMKPAEGLSEDEIKALVAHVRAFKP